MLFLMFYMVIIPLYRMVATTFTWQLHDLTRVPDAEVGAFTLFHYARMLTGVIGRIYTYIPLQHSLTIATGATVLALLIGGSMAWLVVRTDMPGRKVVNQLALLPYIMPSWTLAQAWLVLFKNRLSGGTPGLFEYVVGISPPNWLSYGPVPIIICCALHYYTFFFLFVSAALMSIDSNLEHNIARIVFDDDITRPTPNQIRIRELLPGGLFGPDLSGNFTFTVENDGGGHPRILRVWEDALNTTNHGTWYSVANLGDWPGVSPFQLDYQVAVGDASADGRVLAFDVSVINTGIPTFSSPDDERRDINGDGRVLAIDVSVTNGSIPYFGVPKPSGH